MLAFGLESVYSRHLREGADFLQLTSHIVLTKRTLLAWKHAVWVSEIGLSDSTRAQGREKHRTGQNTPV